MKNINIAILFLAVCFSGCAGAGGYLVDRSHDFADIFTLTFGTGVGAKARIGPIHITPFMYQNDRFGLRGGVFFYSSKGPPAMMDRGTIDVGYFFLLATENFARRGYHPVFGKAGQPDLARQRGKCFSAASFFPFTSVPYWFDHVDGIGNYVVYPKYYFTQLEIILAAGPSLRLGFNPGELLDFVLGWAAVDIFNDDFQNRQKSKAPDNITAQS